MKTTRSSFHAVLLLLWLPLATLGGTTYYISPSGLDSNAGTEVSAPLKTIGNALRKARYGDTILLRDGTYREQVWGATNVLPGLSLGGGAPDNMLTIARYATNEVPVIKGSVLVTNWQRDTDSVWKVTGWTNRSQQVFANEQLLTHLGWNAPLDLYPWGNLKDNLAALSTLTNFVAQGRRDMVPGTFFHDTNTSTLYVRLFDNGNPNSKVMEASVGIPLLISYPFVRIDGLSFRHSSVLSATKGWPSVSLANNSVIQNSAVEWCDFGGLSLRENSQILNCRIANNGMIGFSIGSNSVVRGSAILNNHYLPFDIRGEAAGTKIISRQGRADNLIIENNEFGGNNGPGIWFDTMNNPGAPAIIRGNDIHHNGDGIMLEISTNILVYNNIIDANTYRGVYFSQAVDCRVYNNTIIVPFTAPTQPAYKVVCAFAVVGGWGGRSDKQVANISITNNLIYDETVYAAGTLRTGTYSMGPSTTNIIVDYNCYYAPNAADKNGVRFGITPYTDLKRGPTNNYRVDFSEWQTTLGKGGAAFDAHSVVMNPLAAPRHGNKLWLKSPNPSTGRSIHVANVTFGKNITAGIFSYFRGTNRPPSSVIATIRDSR